MRIEDGLLLATMLVALPSWGDACSDLSQTQLPNVQIHAASLQAEQVLQPDANSGLTGSGVKENVIGAHCLVEGKIEDRQGVNGQYGIRFQLRLPTTWNGRLMFQGGGGMDGFIAPAIGSIPSNGSSAVPSLSRGYAVVSMDGGHDGRDAEFAYDQQARLDLAYASIGKVTHVAKALIDSYYEQSLEHTFFMGCSNGGREAMMAAQRFPLEFDGIVAGNPGFHLSAAAIAQAWDVNQLMTIAPNGILSQALTQADLDAVSQEILKACDATDGLADGIVAAPNQCNITLDDMPNILTEEKMAALKAVMAGPKDSQGNALYSDWPLDPAINTPGWRLWKLGFSETEQSDALNVLIGRESLPKLFMTPPLAELPQNIDFDAIANQVSEIGALNDATSTYLSTFAYNGGKMVIFQGMADPVFSANDITKWYEKTTTNTKDDFAQLYLVPGLTHCGGGQAFDDFDPLTILENWVINGEKATQMPAQSTVFEGKSMPICAYPKEAYYTGNNPNDITSYSCQ